MFSRWICGLSLSLCVAGAAHAQGPAPSAPVVSLGRPIAVSRPAAAPAVTLGRPVASSATSHTDSAVRPASFTARGSAPDPLPARRMPTEDSPVSQWRRADPVIATAPRGLPTSTAEGATSGPLPLTPSPTGPVTGGPITSVPLGDCGPAPLCGEGGCIPGGALLPERCGSRLWVGADYLLWWVRGDQTPALVTTGPTVPGQVTGILGQPGTRVLFGNSNLNDGARSGARLNLVWWFNEERCWGLDASGFFLGEQQDRFSAFSTGDPVLARPFTDLSPSNFNLRAIAFNPDGTLVTRANPLFGQQNVQQVANPTDLISPADNSGALAGGVDIVHKSTLWGYDINLRRGLWCGENFNCDLLFGYRQMGLDESLSITERLVATGPRVGLLASTGAPVVLTPSGTSFLINDKFSATNRFYGGQLGFDSEWRRGRWFIGCRSKLALGTTEQIVNISGVTRITPPVQFGPGATTPGGLLALPGTNIGRYSRNVFSVIPEVGLSLGYQFTPWLRGTVGYNFLYWNNVVRPGGTIDTGVNRTFQGSSVIAPTGAARPAFRFDDSSLWAHGLTLGLECRF